MAQPPRDLAYQAARRRHPHCHDIRLHYSDEVPWDNEALAKKNRELEALAQGAPLPPTTDELRPGSVTEPPHRCSIPGCACSGQFLPNASGPTPSGLLFTEQGAKMYTAMTCGIPTCPDGCNIHTRFGRPPQTELPPLEQHCFVNCLSCGAYLEFWFLPGNIVLHCVQRLGSPLQVMASVGMKDDLIHCWRCANKYLIYYSLNPAHKTDEAPEAEMAEEGVPAPPKLPDR